METYPHPVLSRVKFLKSELLTAQTLVKEQKEKIRQLERKLKEESTNAATYGETALKRLEEKEQLAFQYTYKMENLEWMLYEKEKVTENLRKHIERKVGQRKSSLSFCGSSIEGSSWVCTLLIVSLGKGWMGWHYNLKDANLEGWWG